MKCIVCFNEECTCRFSEKTTTTFKKAEVIIEGVDLNYDSLQLMGYLVSLGWIEKVMPTEHLMDLHNRLIHLYENQKPAEKRNAEIRQLKNDIRDINIGNELSLKYANEKIEMLQRENKELREARQYQFKADGKTLDI